MISIQTRRVGMSEVSEAAALEFPLGLPGFEWSRRFAVVGQPEFSPIVRLQSLDSEDGAYGLCPCRRSIWPIRWSFRQMTLECLAWTRGS